MYANFDPTIDQTQCSDGLMPTAALVSMQTCMVVLPLVLIVALNAAVLCTLRNRLATKVNTNNNNNSHKTAPRTNRPSGGGEDRETTKSGCGRPMAFVDNALMRISQCNIQTKLTVIIIVFIGQWLPINVTWYANIACGGCVSKEASDMIYLVSFLVIFIHSFVK